MKNYCIGCRHELADTHNYKDNSYYCTNEKSECFGKETGEGCDLYNQGDWNMSLKEALEINIFLEEGCYPDFFYRFGGESDPTRPFMWISFPDNEHLDRWRDAHMRLFNELMKIKEEDGDFDD